MTTDLLTIYNQVPEPIRKELLGKMGNPWYLVARRDQIVPRSSPRHLIQAGRGWGKNRAAAEWIIDMAGRYPGTYMALIGQTEAYAYNIMLDGESGIFTLSAKFGRDIPTYDTHTGVLTWANGSKAFVRGLDSSDNLSGYNHQFAWLDLGDQHVPDDDQLRDTWGVLTDGNNRGVNPQILVTAGHQDNWLTDLFSHKVNGGNPYWTKAGT